MPWQHAKTVKSDLFHTSHPDTAEIRMVAFGIETADGLDYIFVNEYFTRLTLFLQRE
jgi:hypothetical protein